MAYVGFLFRCYSNPEKRAADVATAGASVVFYEQWRQTGEQRLLDEIHDYNRTDCISTQLLRDWLVRNVRPAAMPWPTLAEAPAGGTLSNVEAEDAELEALRQRLEPVRARLGDQVATLLLDLSQFHKREDKPAYWAIFDRLAQESEELLDDLDCLQGLESVDAPVQVTTRSSERTYRFPDQETKLRAGKAPCIKPATMPEPVPTQTWVNCNRASQLGHVYDHQPNLVTIREIERRTGLQFFPDHPDWQTLLGKRPRKLWPIETRFWDSSTPCGGQRSHP